MPAGRATSIGKNPSGYFVILVGGPARGSELVPRAGPPSSFAKEPLEFLSMEVALPAGIRN